VAEPLTTDIAETSADEGVTLLDTRPDAVATENSFGGVDIGRYRRRHRRWLSMRTGYRRCVGALAAFALGFLLLGVSPASAAARVGGISVEDWCMRNLGYHAVVRPPRDAFSWRCSANPGDPRLIPKDQGVDMNQACRQQYPRVAGVYASWASRSDPGSWSCYRP
jgi:hypothetical protein